MRRSAAWKESAVESDKKSAWDKMRRGAPPDSKVREGHSDLNDKEDPVLR